MKKISEKAKSLIKISTVLLISIFAFLTTSCKETVLIIEHIIREDFVIENHLEEDVNLTATINSKTHSIDIKSGEKYKYWLDTGSLESNKIHVYEADTIVFSTASKSITFKNITIEDKIKYLNYWIHDTDKETDRDKYFYLIIDEALFENQ